MTEINRKIADLRKEANLTQADLAQCLGITQAQVSKFEANGEIPTRLLRQWASAIGRSPEELLPSFAEEEIPQIFDFDNSLYGSHSEELNLLLQYIDRFPHLVEVRDVSGGLTVEQFRARVTAHKEKPWVVFTGHFDAGKSHLCNFYLGGNHLPTGYRPVTRYPTFIRHTSDRPNWVKEDLWLMGPDFAHEKWKDETHCKTTRILAGSWDTLEQHATLKGETNNPNEGAVLAFVDAPILNACVMVDLPGYDDKMTNATVIDRLGRRADILLYLCPAQGFMDGGDFTRIRHLLDTLPRHEMTDPKFPILGNLFIIASHAHPGINASQLKEEILDDGSAAFYEHFEGTLLRRIAGMIPSISSITRDDISGRFFSFWAEIPSRREKLENALHTLLGKHLPVTKQRLANEEIMEFKAQGPKANADYIDKYRKILDNKKNAEKHFRMIFKEEPARKKRHAKAVKYIKKEITDFMHQDIKNLRVVFERHTEATRMHRQIEQRYKTKNKAKKFASAYILDEIQDETDEFRQGLVRKTSKRIESFLKEYNAQFQEFSNPDMGEFSVPFDPKAAFVGGLAGLGTLGALAAWASTLGNLGGYIIVAKGISVLSAIGISTGGTAAATALVATLGGPITLAIGVAVAVGIVIGWLFGDSWQLRLAKKIKALYEEKGVLSHMEDNVQFFWRHTLNAFQSASDNLDKEHRNYVEELKGAFGERQDDIGKLQERLHRYEEMKSFFAAIPWQPRADL